MLYDDIANCEKYMVLLARIPIMIGGKPYCVFSSIKKVKSFFYYFVVSSFLIIFAPNYKRL